MGQEQIEWPERERERASEFFIPQPVNVCFASGCGQNRTRARSKNHIRMQPFCFCSRVCAARKTNVKCERKIRERVTTCAAHAQIFDVAPSGAILGSDGEKWRASTATCRALYNIGEATLEPRAVLTLKINSLPVFLQHGSLCGRDCIVQACGS